MKEKINASVAKAKTFFMNNIPNVAFAASAAILASNNLMVYAADQAQSLSKEILGIIATLIIALGIFLAVMGIVHFASAYSEGDGPAKQKAVMQIAAGVMVIFLSSILKNKADTLAKYITDTTTK